jgi:ATP-binding cassette subfamily B protein
MKHWPDLTLSARLCQLARPYWRRLVCLFLLSLLATPVALAMPLPLKILVDSVLGSHPLPGGLSEVLPVSSASALLLLVVGLVVAIAVVDQLQRLGTEVLGTATAEKLILRFRAELFQHVQRLSLSYHDAKGTADSLYRIHMDAASIQWIIIYGLTPFASALIMLIGMIYVTARVSGQLALIALTAAPVIFLLTLAARRRLRSGWDTTKELESSAYAVVQEVLAGLRVVKAFGQEEREQARFENRSGESVRARVRMAFAEGVFGLLVGLTAAAGTALVVYLGGLQVMAGELTLGDLVLVLGYIAQLYAPVQGISKSIANLQSSLAGAARAFTLLDQSRDVVEKTDARPLARAHGAVAFRNVSFTYDGNRIVLDAVSFEIPPGTRLGIAGATGAGKTTLVNLLCRFYDPVAGQILLDGIDLRDYRLSDLRKQFAIVLQDPVLFSTTVAENIAYARPDAADNEIIAAAKAANAHEFIMRLPDKYDTLVGERGMCLSGGERQRIALARAFLKDAPILILDEPTSSVDVKTEAAIMHAMERLMQGRTTLMIAHRLTTLAHCDARLEIDGGRVARMSREAMAAAVAQPS